MSKEKMSGESEEVMILVDEDGNEIIIEDEGQDSKVKPKKAPKPIVEEEDDSEYDDEYDEGGSVFSGMANKLLIVLGALVAVIAIGIGIYFISSKGGSASGTDFSNVGKNMAAIGIIGGDNVEKITSTEGARLDALYDAVKSYDYDEADSETGITTVSVTLTSILKDLKVKFVNSKGKLIANVPFAVEVTDANGKTTTWTDTDKDGIIYQGDLSGGTYKVKLVMLNGYETMYDFSQAQEQSIAIKTQPDYQKVDVKNEIKSSSQVDAKEDAAQNETVQESKLTDTVTYVMSEKVQSSNGYIQIDRATTVVDPVATLTATYEAALFRFKRLRGLSNPVNVDHTHNYTYSSDGAGNHTGTCDNADGGCTDVTVNEACDTNAADGSCSKCGYKAPAAHTHRYDTWDGVVGNGSHTMKCTETTGTCEATTTTVACDNNGANGSCSVCGYKAPVAHTHKYDTWDGVKGNGNHTMKCTETVGTCEAATTTVACDTAGTGGACSVCGYKAPETLKSASVAIGGAPALSIGKTATVSASVTVDPTTYSAASYSWSVVSGSEYVSIESGANTASATIKGVKAGKATLKCSVTINDAASTVKDATVEITVNNGVSISIDRTAKKAVFIGGETFTVTATTKNGSTNKVTWEISDKDAADLSGSESVKDGVGTSKCTITAKKAGKYVLTVKSADDSGVKQTLELVFVNHPKNDKTTPLLDKDGNKLFVLENNVYREAVYADYYTGATLYKGSQVSYSYRGWWTIDGKTYYYDNKGKKVTGEQVILGAKYTFDSEGVLKSGTGSFGIDVSTWNGTIDWSKVAKSGVSYAIIRCGFRGTTVGGLVQDNKFETNMKNATAAGIKVGVYFFTQAISEAEAIEEASMCLQLVEGQKLTYPIFIDVESATNGRANKLSKDERTKIVSAFCKTVTNGGYKAGVYANKSWFTNNLNVSDLTSYTIWLAQYASSTTYTASRYDLWQYSSTGSISGISGNVDLDLSYMGY